jgi:hypothetical protein
MANPSMHWREAPPSVLSDISPARGEIGCAAAFAFACTVEGKGKVVTRAISPLAGEMPTGRGGRLALSFKVKAITRSANLLGATSCP